MSQLKMIGIGLSVVFILFASFIAFVLWSTWPPNETDPATRHCTSKEAPTLVAGKPFKVLSWNVQFMAGKGYVFFFDVLENTGKDTRPTRQSIETTLDGVADVIDKENPDFVFLQEVDEGAKRTDFQDQLTELLKRKDLASRYPCSASAFYWKAKFIPHPKILGSTGLKLSVLSKYKLKSARRIALPKYEANWIVQQFQLKRVLLEVLVENSHGRTVHLINTHFEAFAQGTGLMEKQTQVSLNLLEEIEKSTDPWIFGGDLNLLLPGEFQKLDSRQQAYYVPNSELVPLLKYRHFPTQENMNSSDRKKFITHFPNDPEVKEPNRTIDYLFYSSQVKALGFHVRQNDTLSLSDHFPVVGEFLID